MNAEDSAPSTAAHVLKPPREAQTQCDTLMRGGVTNVCHQPREAPAICAAAADLVGIISEPPVQTPEKVAEDPSVRGDDVGDVRYICILLLLLYRVYYIYICMYMYVCMYVYI
jgi:hypothetical protein